MLLGSKKHMLSGPGGQLYLLASVECGQLSDLSLHPVAKQKQSLGSRKDGGKVICNG